MNPIRAAHIKRLAKDRLTKPVMASPEDRDAHWRKSLPWTDAQIIDAIDREADVWAAQGNSFMERRYRSLAEFTRRTGRITRNAIRHAAHVLVTTCEFCHRTAIYRYGAVGRCREHKSIMSAHFAAKAIALMVGHDDARAMFRERNIAATSSAAHHQATGRQRQRKDRRS